MVHRVEERTGVGVEHPIHLLPHEPDPQRIQRVVLGLSRRTPRAVRGCDGASSARLSGIETQASTVWRWPNNSCKWPGSGYLGCKMRIAPKRRIRSAACGHAGPQSWRTTLSSEPLILMGRSPLYSMKPSFLNLFKKKFTRERVVPTISASVSCEIRGTTRVGLSCFP